MAGTQYNFGGTTPGFGQQDYRTNSGYTPNQNYLNGYHNYPYTSQPGYNPMTANQLTNIGNQPVQQNTSTIFGRLVIDENEITPNEIPMDGSIALFPKSDYTCVYAKQRDRNDVIQTVMYVPAAPKDEPEQIDVNGEFESIKERLDRIEERLNRRNSKPYNKNQNGSYNRKHEEE